MLDTTSLLACAGVLLLYNALALALRRASGLNLMLQTGRQWTQKHMSGRSAPDVTLAVQTLRNTVLVATFVGTLSFTVTTATLSAVAGIDDAPARVRALLHAALLCGSFLNFALVIRCAAYAGYLIGAFPAPADAAAAQQQGAEEGCAGAAAAAAAPPAEVATLLQMQAVHFSLGFRFMYCSIPFAFAAVGAEALIVSTFMMICFLGYIDNALSIWAECGREAAQRMA